MRTPRLDELEEKYIEVASYPIGDPELREKVKELELLLNEIIHQYKKEGREI